MSEHGLLRAYRRPVSASKTERACGREVAQDIAPVTDLYMRGEFVRDNNN
jgi:hypothetical protein